MALFLYFLVIGRYALPVFDLLDLADAALAMPSLAWVIHAQNASADFAIRALVLADIRLFAGSTVLHTAIGLLASLIAFIGIAAAIDRTAHPARELATGATGLLALIWFRAATLEPYAVTPGADHLMLAAGAVCCLGLAASIGPREPHALRTLFAALFGLAAASTLASGLLVLPLAAVVLWRRCDRDWPAMLVAVLGALAIATYAVIAPPGGAYATNPLDLLRFMAWMFGSPWVKVMPVPGEVAGWWTIALCAAVAGFGLFGRHVDGSGAFSGALAAFALGAALMTAIARLPNGLEQATSGRYGLLTAVAHASLIVAAVRQLRLRRTVLSGITGAALVVIGGVLLAEQVVIGQRYAARADIVAGVRAEVLEGRFDPERLGLIHADGARAAELLRRLAEAGLYGLKRPDL